MAEDKLQKLKEKYVSVLNVINKQDLRLEKMHLEDDKLFIRAEAPSDSAKNQFWDAVKKVDPNYSKDLTAQISVAQAQQQPKAAEPKKADVTPVGGQQAQQQKAEQTYTVSKGDTLSAISKRFYGDANQYMKIFEANRDQLKDPDKIQIGQVLKIPAAEKMA